VALPIQTSDHVDIEDEKKDIYCDETRGGLAVDITAIPSSEREGFSPKE
jgi:hypothetical protein